MLQKNFAIQVTRCNLLAVLTGTGETALFTFSRLIPVSKLLRVTLEDFISNVSDHISVTWDVQIDPDKLDLRWHDSSGDTFVLRNTTSVTYFICIDLNGVDIRTRAICFLPDLSLISTSCASCAYLAIEPFPLDIYHMECLTGFKFRALMSSFNFLSNFSCCRAVVWFVSR